MQEPRELLRFRGHARVALELDVHVGLRPLVGADGAVGARHAVIEEHHVVLDHPEPARLGVPAGARRVFPALEPLPLIDIRAGAVQPRFFVVPECKTDRALGLHVGIAEDAGQLHHERGARAVVVRRFAPTVAIHVRTDDVHLVGT
jgi:hypothetical protein